MEDAAFDFYNLSDFFLVFVEAMLILSRRSICQLMGLFAFDAGSKLRCQMPEQLRIGMSGSTFI